MEQIPEKSRPIGNGLPFSLEIIEADLLSQGGEELKRYVDGGQLSKVDPWLCDCIVKRSSRYS